MLCCWRRVVEVPYIGEVDFLRDRMIFWVDVDSFDGVVGPVVPRFFKDHCLRICGYRGDCSCIAY
jgi:hypothetical protein